MDTDEREIFEFLKIWGGGFTAAREIARRAGTKKRFHSDPDWAKPILLRMAERGILESDIQGRFRIKPISHKEPEQQRVAPEGSKVLQESNATVESDGLGDSTDEYYEKL